jgi:hypothetical protein
MDGARGLRLLAALLAALATAPAVATSPPTPADIASAAGAWDLALEGSHRRCRVTLAVEAAGIGRALRFPVGCRRALPILSGASSWMADKGAIRLLDSQGRAVLHFAPGRDEGSLTAAAGSTTYRLERQDRDVVAARLPPPPAPGVPQVTQVDPAKAPPADSVPGLYIVDRYSEREVCRLDLAPRPSAGAGRYEARILEGCRDGGLALFDPIAWRYEAGRLTLSARRGHEVTLISERKDHWRRDPEVGATLILRKVTP